MTMCAKMLFPSLLAALAASAAVALAVTPALALDCSKAATETETLICAEPALKAADDAMSAAYTALAARIAADQKAPLLQSQRSFIAQREWCGGGEGAHRCIVDQTVARQRYLAGGIEPGALRGPAPVLEPLLVQQAGDVKKTLYTVDYSLIRFANPATAGETAFNAAMDAIAAEATLGDQSENGDEMGSVPYDDSSKARITLLTPEIIAAEIEDYVYSGGAHGNGGVYSVALNRQTGETIDIAKAIGPTGVNGLVPLCREAIAEAKAERYGASEVYEIAKDDFYSDETVIDHIKGAGSWRLEPGKATVTFNSYALGSYAEGRYECSFAAELIHALSRGALDLR
jgi:hypothetical protein